MAFRWKTFKVSRFFGLDLKTNPYDVKDTLSLDLKNSFQNSFGVISKRKGNDIMFGSDEASDLPINEIGSAIIGGTKYYFRFADGDFKYSTSISGSVTTISPSPAIATDEHIWWAVLDNKLFFVDGTNDLRYFDGSTISTSSIYQRPTTALQFVSGAGTGRTFVYTVDNGLGESPQVVSAGALTNRGDGCVVRILTNTGPQTLVAGDIVRVYQRTDSVASGSINVTPGFAHTVTAGEVVAGQIDIDTDTLQVSIDNGANQLYTELGYAVNKTAPTALAGIVSHYGRLVGWKDEKTYSAKISNPHSFPDEGAPNEAFVHQFGVGDGEPIRVCVSFQESLFVLKRTKIAIFAGLGPNDSGSNSYAFRRLETNGIGCCSPKSAIVVGEDESQMLVFNSDQGFYATNGGRPIRIGERIETQIIGLSDATKDGACAFHHKREGQYICFIGAPTNKVGWALDVRKDDGVYVGWFKWEDINPTCVFWDDDKYIFGDNNGYCYQERMSGAADDYRDTVVERVDPSDVDTTDDEITVANDYDTVREVVFRSTGTLPSPLVANTSYWLIPVDSTTIQVAATEDDAFGGIPIDLTTQGTGVHTLATWTGIDAYYTTNWFKFEHGSIVKKLGRLAVVFNVNALDVNIDIRAAYDWSNTYYDLNSVVLSTSVPWGAEPWGDFVWGQGALASPRSISLAKRKCRSIRLKFSNANIDQNLEFQGIEIPYDYIRNRGNFITQ